MWFGLAAAGSAAPLLEPVAVLGTEAWRAPGTIESLVVAGDRIWVATSEVVIGFDASGARIATFPICEGRGLYPDARIALSPAGDRMATPCGDVRVLSVPDGVERWRATGLTGSIRPVFSADGDRLLLVAPVVTPEGLVGELRLREYGATGKLLRDRASPWIQLFPGGDGYVSVTLDDPSIVGLDGALVERWRAPQPPDLSRIFLVGDQVCFGGYRRVDCRAARTGAEGPPMPVTSEIERIGTAAGGLWASWDEGRVHRWAPGQDPVLLPNDPPGDEWTPWGEGALAWRYSPRVVRLRMGDGPPLLVDRDSGRSVPLLLEGRPARYASVVYGADGSLWATLQTEAQAEAVWARVDPSTGVAREIAPIGSVYEIEWLSPDGRTVAWRWDDSVHLADTATGTFGYDQTVYAPKCGVASAGGAWVTCREGDEGEQLGEGPVVAAEIAVGPPGAPWISRPYDGSALEVRRGDDPTVLARVALQTTGDPVFSGDGRRIAAVLPDGRVAVVALP